MKKIILSLFMFLLSYSIASAQGVGYVDYSVIYKELPISKQLQKQIDLKAQAVRNYNQATKTQLSSKKTEAEKEQVRTSRKAQLIKLEKEYIELRYKQEAVVKAKVKTASDIVLSQKKLDIIIDKKMRVSGGVDCTSDILKAIK